VATDFRTAAAQRSLKMMVCRQGAGWKRRQDATTSMALE
jgi:hypothetical protein